MHSWVYVPAIWMIVWGVIREWRAWRARRDDRARREEIAAINLFVRTGKASSTFEKLSGKAFARTVSLRKAHLFTKEKETKFSDFSAECECPSCGKIDIHGFQEVVGKVVYRECNIEDCGYVWTQS